MNPFFFPPRQIPNVGAALYVLGLYDQEIAGSVDQTQGLREQLDAIADVLRQKHPDLIPDLDLLIDAAVNVGQLQGARQDLDTLKSQFRASLPFGIRKSLETPSQ